MLEGWQLGMLEDYGLTDTNTGLINRVARKLAESQNSTINTEQNTSGGIHVDAWGMCTIISASFCLPKKRRQKTTHRRMGRFSGPSCKL